VNKLGTPLEFDGKMMETSWEIAITSWEHIESNIKINTPHPPSKEKTI
jgi:hypothetical protein